MARATYADLIPEVRAQIDTDDDTIFGWLLDRSRVLNAEAMWLLRTGLLVADGSRAYPLPDDCLWVEAVVFGSTPYQRSTMHSLDMAWAGTLSPPVGVYADGADESGTALLQVYPAATGGEFTVRYVGDVPDDRTLPPPFPPDFDQALVEGAIAVGLARMDERFDSAGYFDERFVNAVARLKRRRAGHIGRGATKIRVFG